MLMNGRSFRHRCGHGRQWRGIDRVNLDRYGADSSLRFYKATTDMLPAELLINCPLNRFFFLTSGQATMQTEDQIVDDFVRTVHYQQDIYAANPGPLPPSLHREIVEGMTIVPRRERRDRSWNSIVGEPGVLRSLTDRYDVSLFSLITFEFADSFSDQGNGRIRIGTMGSEDVLFDTWRKTIETRPQVSERTVLLASDQRHLLDLLLFIQHTLIVAVEQMVPSRHIMDTDEWIAEAGRIGGGEGVSIFFSRHR